MKFKSNLVIIILTLYIILYSEPGETITVLSMQAVTSPRPHFPHFVPWWYRLYNFISKCRWNYWTLTSRSRWEGIPPVSEAFWSGHGNVHSWRRVYSVICSYNIFFNCTQLFTLNCFYLIKKTSNLRKFVWIALLVVWIRSQTRQVIQNQFKGRIHQYSRVRHKTHVQLV